jgi:hypothetical protein
MSAIQSILTKVKLDTSVQVGTRNKNKHFGWESGTV